MNFTTGTELAADRSKVTAPAVPTVVRTTGGDGCRIVSPVSGLLRHVAVKQGDVVQSGDVVAVIEAMKMETPLVARVDGTVQSVRPAGGQLRAGDVVAEIEPGVKRLEG